jgi:3-hydroxybutyryl-CoA dehydratase
MLKIKELNIGQDLPNSVRRVNQEHINLYAAASKDNNPIHIDQEFAKKTGLGGTVAHGMLILAYVSAYMTDNFGLNWLNSGLINIRFKSPARPGDTLQISGKITGLENNEAYKTIRCDILCQNQQGEPVIVGETKVRINN